MTYRYYVGRKAMFDSDFKQGASVLPGSRGSRAPSCLLVQRQRRCPLRPGSVAPTPSRFYKGKSHLRFLLGTRSLSRSPLCPFLGEGHTHVCPTCGPRSVLPRGLSRSCRHRTWGLGSSWLGSSLEGRALALASSPAPVAGGSGSVLRPSCPFTKPC